MVSYFPAGDWTFEHKTFTVPLTPDPCATTPSILGDFKALCFGDVNGSYVPTGYKDVSFLNSADDGGVMTVPVGKSFTYAIRSSKAAEVGAMTMFLNYDANLFEIESVNTTIEGLKYKIDKGTLSIAWSNTTSMSVIANEAVVTLTMKVKQAIAEPVQVFTINTGSEFADGFGVRYDNYDLKLSSIMTSGPGEFSVVNYPNPFQNYTQIVYTIPEQAHVKLTITNMYGVVIATAVDADQAAGSYTVKVNPLDLNMKSGVYLYQIEVLGAANTYSKTGKMLFAR